jgi:hypothetical protein
VEAIAPHRLRNESDVEDSPRRRDLAKWARLRDWRAGDTLEPQLTRDRRKRLSALRDFACLNGSSCRLHRRHQLAVVDQPVYSHHHRQRFA